MDTAPAARTRISPTRSCPTRYGPTTGRTCPDCVTSSGATTPTTFPPRAVNLSGSQRNRQGDEMTEMTPEVRHLLDRPNYAHVATLLPDGAPHSVPVWIAI